MSLPPSVAQHLERHALPYRIVHCPAIESLAQAAFHLEIPARQVVRSVLLQDREGLIMAILPLDHILDFQRLCAILQRDVEPLYGSATQHFFEQYQCSAGCQPPLPGAFAINALVDASLSVDPKATLYCDAGNGNALLQMRAAHFQQLLGNAQWGEFAVSPASLDALLHQQPSTVEENLIRLAQRYSPSAHGEQAETIAELPPMPEMVQWLLALRSKPDLSIAQLLPLLEQNPQMAAQVVYWAHAPLHGYQGVVDSLETAINKVLGAENTLNLMLASYMGQALPIPLDGAVGLHTFWRHSVHCASLTYELAKLLPEPTTVRPELAYLCGLLHDFGFLVLGNAFPARFFLFNRFMEVNRDLPGALIERYVLGIEHWQIGAWLMQAWEMPEEVVSALRWHHHEDCTQPHAEYSNLVLIADRMLTHAALGQETNHRLPALLLFTLGLSREQVEGAVQRVEASITQLDNLALALRVACAAGSNA